MFHIKENFIKAAVVVVNVFMALANFVMVNVLVANIILANFVIGYLLLLVLICKNVPRNEFSLGNNLPKI